jgi:osmotically-inducible protein OsmY
MKDEDARIKRDIIAKLHRKEIVDADAVGVQVEDGAVTLTGTVSSVEARLALYETAVYTKGVGKIIDALEYRSYVLPAKSH